MKKLLIFTLIFFIFLFVRPIKALDVVAKSGYWKDIQDAVNIVAAMGGGSVYIPEGIWNFVNVGESWTGARVVIPAGVNLFGAPTERYANGSVKEWKTVLVMPWDMPGSTSYRPPHWFKIQGNSDPNKSSRFSDIKLVGYREIDSNSAQVLRGIEIESVLNFRIDHCYFRHIPEGIAIHGHFSSGVVDHCVFDNVYGWHGGTIWANRTIGYGITVNRNWNGETEWEPLINLLGKYTNRTVFIENNVFTKWRHCVVGNNGAHYVFRHNTVTNGSAFGEVDVHPMWTEPYVPGRAIEVYENQFINPAGSPPGYPSFMLNAIIFNSGGGVIFNNICKDHHLFIQTNDNSWNSTFYPHEIYIWNNTLINVSWGLIGGSAVENEDYFLYKPDWYTPYPYPHPLTLEELKYYVNLTGVVMDSYTGLAVQGVKISCNNTFSSITNSSGGYFISIPIAAPFSCNISLSKEGYLTNSSIVSFSGNGSYVRNFYISQARVSRITGRIVDKNNNPLQANVIVYQQGSSNVIASNSTSNGYYYLVVSPGVYDIQFNFSLNKFVKLLAVNASEDVNNLIGKVSYESNRIVVEVENNYTKRMEVYSEKRPSEVKLNRTSIAWSYDLNRKVIAINLSVVVAKSGYWKDIQDAVNIVAAMGGGSVYIPEGIWNFVNVGESWTGARVVIPAGVNLFGAPTERYANGSVKEWKTVLVMPWDMPGDKSYNPPHWFLINGTSDPNKPSRFSDIKLVGYRELNRSAVGHYRAIVIKGVQNFRIDHVCIDEIPEGIAVGIQTNYPSSGVIDHCLLDNEYCSYGLDWSTRNIGYGIAVYRAEGGTLPTLWENITRILGQFLNYTVFIEDNVFTKWRSVVIGNFGAHYVFRHNIVKKGLAHGEIDSHPSWNEPYVSCRAVEVYNNTFMDIDPVGNPGPHFVWLHYGGGGVFFNNTISGYRIIDLNSNLGWNESFYPKETYFWNNYYTNASLEDGPMEENVHYFLYKPDWYTPYPYPHPLTLE